MRTKLRCSLGNLIKVIQYNCSAILNDLTWDKTNENRVLPTSKSESRKRSARKIPVFSLVWHLKAACHCFKLAMKSRKSESLRRPSPDTYFNQQPPPSIDIRCFLIRLVNKICIITSKTKMTCRHTSMLAQLLM